MIAADAGITGNGVAKVLRRMVCSECWGALHYDSNTRSFSCRTPGCTCQGMVSERTVERRESTNAVELRKARSALAEALGLPARPAATSASQLLAELGF